MSKPFRVAEARARFGEILDRAEKGSEVVIERHGVRFRLVAESAGAPPRAGTRLFEYVDSAVDGGNWTWEPAATGVRFARRRRR
jgi:antitoxin (DNA-binding transcriptional repressor) of toxin-antitoxin stability system